MFSSLSSTNESLLFRHFLTNVFPSLFSSHMKNPLVSLLWLRSLRILGEQQVGGGLGGNRSFYNKSVLPLQSTCYCKPQRGCAAQLHPHLNSRKLCLAPEVTQRKEVRGGGTKPAWAFKATWECSGSLSTLAVIGKICI